MTATVRERRFTNRKWDSRTIQDDVRAEICFGG